MLYMDRSWCSWHQPLLHSPYAFALLPPTGTYLGTAQPTKPQSIQSHDPFQVREQLLDLLAILLALVRHKYLGCADRELLSLNFYRGD